MPLDQHAKRLLDALGTTRASDSGFIGVQERRAHLHRLISLSPGEAPIGAVEDCALPGPAGPITMRVYTPIERSSGQLPGVVYFHGGGLVAGNLDTHDGICRTLANESGCRVMSVDYRLAPEYKFPAAVMDGYAATRWAVEHAAELGLDQNKIAVAGDSAGATLAAIICQLSRGTKGINLAAQLLLCPITDFAARTESRKAFAEGYLLDRKMMDWDLDHYLPAGVDPADPRISPLRALDLSGLPSAYLHTAEFDPLRDEGMAYAQGLMRSGVKVFHTCHLGMIHFFYGMPRAIPYARTAMKRIGAEMRAALG